MNDQRVGVDHLHRASRHRDAVPARELRRAEIGENRHRPGKVAQPPVEAGHAIALERDALRADREGDARPPRRLGNGPVDRLRPRRAAGH